MNPCIELISPKTLIGIRQEMSLTSDKTGQLWAKLMPRRHEITHSLSSDLISLQIYSPNYFTQFSPERMFEKWACMEVNPSAPIPPDMENLQLPGGLYAVFNYQGLSGNHQIFSYIFNTWLPSSGYMLDQRPHFEVLGEKYKNNDSHSEEEIWIPIKLKN